MLYGQFPDNLPLVLVQGFKYTMCSRVCVCCMVHFQTTYNLFLCKGSDIKCVLEIVCLCMVYGQFPDNLPIVLVQGSKSVF